MDMAARIGWRPADYWSSSFFELTVALASNIEMNLPPPEKGMNDQELVQFFRARPGHKVVKRRTTAEKPATAAASAA
jgi:hypothetical protein